MLNKIRKLLVSCVVASGLFSATVANAQVLTKVTVEMGGDATHRKAAESSLTTFLHALAAKKDVPDKVFTSEGKAIVKGLIAKAPMVCPEPALTLSLIEIGGDAYEVRNIPVQIRAEAGVSNEELVLQLGKDGKILNGRFAMEQENMLKIFNEAEDLVDVERRQIILQFLELYRTAYNRKDVDYIEKTFSEEAIIIVGQVLQPKKTDNINLDNSSLSKDNIRFIRYTKEEYIKRLRTATFKNNAYIQVSFMDMKIVRHPKLKQIYGVNLKQRWNSSTYSDEGFLFLMIDFENEKAPLIHVRSWQPQPFADGSTVNLFDFPIID
jgi:hypothetical protein